MSRLYYPPPQPGALAAGKKKPKFDIQDTAKKVALLIPSELVTAYSGLISLSQNVKHESWRPWLFGFSFVLCLVLTPIYLWNMRDKGKTKPIRIHLIVSTLAFVVWAYFTSGQQVVPDYWDAALASILMVVFSVITALIPTDK